MFPLFLLFLRAILFYVFHKEITANPLNEHSWDAEAEISEAGHE